MRADLGVETGNKSVFLVDETPREGVLVRRSIHVASCSTKACP